MQSLNLFSNTYLGFSLCLLIFFIQYYSLFPMKKVIISNFLFKVLLGVLLLLFILIGVENYFFIVNYLLYFAIIYCFILDTYKIRYLAKILFIILFWIILFKITGIFFDIHEEYKLIMYFSSVLFLADYTEYFDILEIKEVVNDLIKNIESLKLFKKSFLDEGGGGGGPNDPDPKEILDLLNNNRDMDSEEYNTFEKVFQKYKNFHIPYTQHSLLGMGETKRTFDISIDGNNLRFQGETFDITNLNKKVQDHNEKVKDKYENISKGEVKKLKKELPIPKGGFPHIFSYINGGECFFWNTPIKDITPNYFLVQQYFLLYEYTLDFNTLLLTKHFLENKSLDDSNLDLAKKSHDYWLKRQIDFFFDKNFLNKIMNSQEKFTNMFIRNPLDNKYYEEELLENILYLGLRILEHHWTITYIKDHYSMDSIKNMVKPEEIIDFYNQLYFIIKKEVHIKNKEIYNSFKKIWHERSIRNQGIPEFLKYDFIYTSLSKDTFEKTPSDIVKEWKSTPEYKKSLSKIDYKIKSKLKLKIPKIKKPQIKFLHNKFKSK